MAAEPVSINMRTVKVHQCTECGFSSPYKNTLKVHMVKDHGQGILTQKPFQCHLCSYQTFYRGNLEKHIRIHTGERPYQCRFCGKQFSSQSNKKSHENRHQGFHKLSCPYQSCGYYTTRVQEMSAHLASAHPGGPLTMALGGGGSGGGPPRPVSLKVPERGRRKSSTPVSNVDSVTSSSPALPPLSSLASPPSVIPEPTELKQEREHKLLNFLATQMNLGATAPNSEPPEKKTEEVPSAQLPPISSFHAKSMPWNHPLASTLGNEGRQSAVSLSSDEGILEEARFDAGVHHREDIHGYGIVGGRGFESRYEAAPRGVENKPNLEELALQAVEHLTKQISKDSGSTTSSPYKSPDSNLPQNLSLRSHIDLSQEDTDDTSDDNPNVKDESSGPPGDQATESQPSPSTTCHPLGDEEATEALERLLAAGKLFRCPHCNILFPEYSMFVFHMGCHGESNPYQCHFCKVNFSDKFGFLAHFMQCYKY